MLETRARFPSLLPISSWLASFFKIIYIFIMKPLMPVIVNKPWGREVWIANNVENDYCGKILEIKEGYGSSMHFHVEKHETFFILSGKLQVDYIDTANAVLKTVIVESGETLEIERNQPHKLIPKDGDVQIIEVSTLHKDEDSKRIFL